MNRAGFVVISLGGASWPQFLSIPTTDRSSGPSWLGVRRAIATILRGLLRVTSAFRQVDFVRS